MLNRIFRDRHGSWTLISILIATAIVLTVTVVLFVRSRNAWEGAVQNELAGPQGMSGPGGLAAGSTKQTLQGQSVDAARNATCRSNLSQTRQFIEVYRTTSPDSYPPSLEAAGVKTPELLKCPLGGEPYRYDPSTGKVQCIHPGHEAF